MVDLFHCYFGLPECVWFPTRHVRLAKKVAVHHTNKNVGLSFFFVHISISSFPPIKKEDLKKLDQFSPSNAGQLRGWMLHPWWCKKKKQIHTGYRLMWLMVGSLSHDLRVLDRMLRPVLVDKLLCGPIPASGWALNPSVRWRLNGFSGVAYTEKAHPFPRYKSPKVIALLISSWNWENISITSGRLLSKSDI